MLRTLSSIFSLTLLPLAAAFALPVATEVTATAVRADDTHPAIIEEDGAGYAGAVGGYLIAQRAVVNGDADAALYGFLEALSQDSSNVGLQQDAFAAALLKGDVDTAAQLAKVLPVSSESETMVWLVRLADAAKHGDTQTALKVATHLKQAVPELLQFQLLRAYAERERGLATETVIRQLGPVTGIPAQQARQWYHIGRMRAQTGDTKGAIEALEKAYALEPGSLFTTALLSRLYVQTGQQALADEIMERFRVNNPQMALLGMNGGKATPNALADGFNDDIAEVLFDFGVLVWAQGADMTARQIFNVALWLSPDATYALYYSAMIEEYAGAYGNAADKYMKLTANPEVGDAARLRLAELLFKEGDTEEATKQVDVLLKAHPQDIGALRAQAEIAFEAQDYAKAAKGYEALLKLMPKETDEATMAGLWFALGASQERMGKIEKAAGSLQKSLTYQPTNPGVLNYLGYMWVEHGVHLDQAFVLLNSALLLAPQDGAIMDSVGWAYFIRGDTDQALVFLEQAAELTPDDPVVMDHLGEAYHKQGRTMEAVWHWQRALTLAAKDPKTHAQLIRDTGRKIRRYE